MEVQLLADSMDSLQIVENEVTGFARNSETLTGRKKSRRWLVWWNFNIKKPHY